MLHVGYQLCYFNKIIFTQTPELEIKATTAVKIFFFLLYLINGSIATKLYEKRDEFEFSLAAGNFHYISIYIEDSPASDNIYYIYIYRLYMHLKIKLKVLM